MRLAGFTFLQRVKYHGYHSKEPQVFVCLEIVYKVLEDTVSAFGNEK